MRLVADLHIHSHFSRATSKDLTFEHLTKWAQLKGVNVVATGDIAHPGWLQEMRVKLEPAEEGLFRLRSEPAAEVERAVYPACRAPVRFVLGGEVSNIYKKDGKTRKVHHVIFAPDLGAVERIQAALEKIGNIRSDGRPILGLDSRDLLEIILTADDRCHLIPAHIWTPWFALLGSMSGFDAVEECFGDLTPHIFALETGLSSDPPMNWRVSNLDRYTLVSNSDAHSPQKLAREATLFDTELSYAALFAALRSGDPAQFRGTVEFFPEEGKYHLDGHRKCGVCWEPPTTLAHQGICPVCGREVTVGVMHRVEELADRPAGALPPHPHPFHRLVPLPEVLAELFDVGAGSRQVDQEYHKLLGKLGPELFILREAPLEAIAAAGGGRLAEGIAHMRRGQVQADAGYDGEYGVIRVLSGAPAGFVAPQMGLFGAEAGLAAVGEAGEPYAAPDQDMGAGRNAEPAIARPEGPISQTAVLSRSNDVSLDQGLPTVLPSASLVSPRAGAWEQPDLFPTAVPENASTLLAGLNPSQREAVACIDAPLVIVAGPGTGKTRTLTVRIAHLVRNHQAAPESILAITFTNKAAGEMADRLEQLLGAADAARLTVKTFHAFGAWLLHTWGERIGLAANFAILDEEDRRTLLCQAMPDLAANAVDDCLAAISTVKNQLIGPDDPDLPEVQAQGVDLRAVYRSYGAALRAASAVDFDDLVFASVRLLDECPDVLAAVQARFRWIAVDEYQDINLAQYRLLRLLAADGANLCVIGDPDQAIYGFRGADRRYFLTFAQDYPGARQLHLSQNYRSSQRIVDAALQVISRGSDGQARRLVAAFADEVKLDVLQAPTDRAEAETIVHQIEQMVGGTSYFSLDSGRVEGEPPAAPRAFGDFVVLYRLNAQARLLAEAFERSGIPYQTVGQASLASYADVRAVLAWLWLLENPRSRAHLETVLSVGRGLPASVLARVWRHLETSSDGWAALEQLAGSWSGPAATGARLGQLVQGWRILANERSAQPVSLLVEEAHRLVLAQRDAAADPQEVRRMQQLALRAVPFDANLREFLEAAALQSETDYYDPRADRVTLMTLHAAKGLEFPVVFVAGCEDGLLPYRRPGSASSVEDADEERRLFYVGMTRARQKLILTHARTRLLYGQRTQPRISPFVEDIAAALKELRELGPRAAQRPDPDDLQLSLF